MESRAELDPFLVVVIILACIVRRKLGKVGMERRRQGRCEPAIGFEDGQRFMDGRTCIITPTSFAPGKERARARPGLPLLRLPRCCACEHPTVM